MCSGRGPQRTEKETLIDGVLTILNEALALDRTAVSKVFTFRQPCNEDLAYHPHVTVKLDETGYSVSALGLLNGVMDLVTSGVICAVWDEASGLITGFVYRQDVTFIPLDHLKGRNVPFTLVQDQQGQVTAMVDKGVTPVKKEEPAMVLSEHGEALQAQFHAEMSDKGCTCFRNPPCDYCAHPGNPLNLEQDADAWVPNRALVQEDPAQIFPTQSFGEIPFRQHNELEQRDFPIRGGHEH